MGGWAELTGGVSGPWWVSSERRFLCCRVVMLLAWVGARVLHWLPALLLVAMIWEGCMLARRSVSSGSPIFMSSSVMVPTEVEGWEEDVGMLPVGTVHSQTPSQTPILEKGLPDLPVPCLTMLSRG